MNTFTLRQKDFDQPATTDWTPVEKPIGSSAEAGAVQGPRHRALCIGRLSARGLIFLALGATGLWAVVDLVKNATDMIDDA
ncbi:MAG: hypothetical protein VW644_09980 [Alphaproteobacteria bacterium]